MAQALVRNLNDNTLDDYRVTAKAKGRSPEAELRALIERNRSLRAKNAEELDRLSRESRVMRLPDGPAGTDSTPLIRWDRDTDHGRRLGDDRSGDARR